MIFLIIFNFVFFVVFISLGVVCLNVIIVFIFLKYGIKLLNLFLWLSLFVSNIIGCVNVDSVFLVVNIFVVFELL